MPDARDGGASEVMKTDDVTLRSRVDQLLRESLIWDNHLCMPLRPQDESFLPQLERCRNLGYTTVSLNIGFDAVPWENAVATLASMRRWVSLHGDKYRRVHTVADVEACRADGRLGVCFDIEGGVALNGQLPMVQLYYELGVRWMLFAYNLNNALAGGCQDDNQGLTDFGREVLAEMERVGMAVCCSHTSYEASREILKAANRPVIFSHSNPRSVTDHYRNIPDELMRACAATDRSATSSRCSISATVAPSAWGRSRIVAASIGNCSSRAPARRPIRVSPTVAPCCARRCGNSSAARPCITSACRRRARSASS